MNVTFTESPANQALSILKGEGDDSLNVRCFIQGGGCSGFQYNFSFEITPNKDDIIFNEAGIDYLIDKVSIDFIKGSTLEYISELSGSYFQIVNPNATANCGCGTSFSI